MTLVRVWTDVGARKPVALIAKIIERDGFIYTIKYLSESNDKIWRYEDETYDIDDDSIAEYIDDLTGFRPYEDGFIKVDSDEDYIPSSDEEDDDEDENEDEDEAEDDEDEAEADETEDEADEDEEEFLDEE